MEKGLIRKITGGVITGGVIAAGVFSLGYLLYMSFNQAKIFLRTDKKIERGYISPKGLDITLQDQNKNGEKEVVLRYNFDSYALMEDEFGNPVLKRYEVKPSESPKIIIKD